MLKSMNAIEYTEVDEYSAFLPERFRALVRPPTDSWWTWRSTRVHIARAADPSAAVRVMVIHGAGGHAGALWPGAAVVAAQGAEVFAPDLPLYGRTEVRDPGNIRYRDWVDLLCELIVAEKASDPRPLILFGASMGGLLAYEAAARTGIVDAVVVTCLLDTADVAAREAAARWATLGRNAPRTLPVIAKVAGKLRVPVRWLTPMSAMSNNPALALLCASDPLGGGGRIPLGFLADWFTFAHTAPEDYRGPAVTLAHPGADRWTPPQLSERFLSRIAGPTNAVRLENCGHFPVEDPGLTQLEATARSVLAAVARS